MRVLDWFRRSRSKPLLPHWAWPTIARWAWPTIDEMQALHGRPVIVYFDPADEVPTPSTRRFLQMVGHWDGSRLTLTSASPPFSLSLEAASQCMIRPILGPATLGLFSRILPATYFKGIKFAATLKMATVPEAAWPLPARSAPRESNPADSTGTPR